MSIAGGVHKAVLRGAEIGCTAVQVFTKSNRQWSYDTDFSEETKTAFAETLKNTNISGTVSHAAYLINIGSPKKETEDKSVKALAAELQRCGNLGIPYVVLHPGSHLDGDKETCLQQIARNIDAVMQDAPDNVWLLLETMAGQGSSVGSTFTELASIYDKLKTTRNIGYCFDTCHAFAAGYTFNTQESYTNMWNQFDTYLDLNRLKAIHLNDSKKAAGSCVDRHEHIGHGEMGIEPFRLLMNDTRFFGIPKILETPKDSPEDDIRNLQALYDTLTDQHKQEIAVHFPKRDEIKQG